MSHTSRKCKTATKNHKIAHNRSSSSASLRFRRMRVLYLQEAESVWRVSCVVSIVVLALFPGLRLQAFRKKKSFEKRFLMERRNAFPLQQYRRKLMAKLVLNRMFAQCCATFSRCNVSLDPDPMDYKDNNKNNSIVHHFMPFHFKMMPMLDPLLMLNTHPFNMWAL